MHKEIPYLEVYELHVHAFTVLHQIYTCILNVDLTMVSQIHDHQLSYTVINTLEKRQLCGQQIH